MEKYNLSSLENIAAAAEQAQKKAENDPLQFGYNCGWQYGYAAALKDIVEQLKPLDFVEVLVCIYENHHGRTIDVSAHRTDANAYSSVDAVKKTMGFNENNACDDELFDFDVHRCYLSNSMSKENGNEG